MCRVARVLLLVSLIAAPLSAAPLADRIPADAIFYVGLAGQTEASSQSLVAQLIAEPSIQRMLTAFDSAIAEGKVDNSDVIAHALPLLNMAAESRAAFAVMDMPTGSSPIPQAVLLLDLGEDRPEFQRRLDELMQPAAPMLRVVTVSGVECRRFQPDENGPVITMGYVDDVLFIVAGTELSRRVIPLLNGSEHGGLAAAEKFGAAYAEVTGEDEQVVFYADFPAVVSVAEQCLGMFGAPVPVEMISPAIDAMGLGGVRTIAGATRIVDGCWQSKTRIASPAPHQGLLMLAAGRPVEADWFDLAPADALYMAAASISPAAVLGEVRRGIAAIDPDMVMMVDMLLAQGDAILGVSIEEDIVASLGDRWMIVSAPSLGGFLTGTMLVAELQDADKFVSTVESLLVKLRKDAAAMEDDGWVRAGTWGELLSGSVEQFGHEGVEVSYASMPLPIAPAWAIHEGRLYFSLWPQVVQAALMVPGGLAEQEGFRATLSRLDGQPGMVSYVNQPEVAKLLYSTPLMLSAMIGNMLDFVGLDFKPDWLPPLPTLQKYTRPSIATVGADAAGVTFQSYSAMPIDAPLMDSTAMSAPLMAGVMLRSFGSARSRARESVSMSNLKSIGVGIAMYEIDQGETPESLEDLIDEGFFTERALVSPISDMHAYVYIRLPEEARHDLILAYEDPFTHGKRETAVLFRDTSVRIMPVDEEFWERSKQASREAYGNAEQDGFEF